MAFTPQPLSEGMLHDAARRYAADAAGDAGAGHADPCAALGWASILIPEQAGGSGGTVADLCAIIEGLAPSALALPVLERCAIAPLLLQAGAGQASVAKCLADVAAGVSQVAPLVGQQPGFAAGRLRATPLADGAYRLDGEICGVDDGLPASHYLLLADTPAHAPLLVLLEALRLLPPVARYTAIDGARTADYRCADLVVAAAECIAVGAPVRAAAAQAEDTALLGVCVDTVATAGEAIAQVIAYLQTRVQFGAPLAGQQALRHRVADMYVRYESMRGLVASLLHGAQGTAPPDRRDLQLAKCVAGETARQIAEDTIQLHGGMGMSEETLAARLAERLLANEFRFGDRFYHGTALDAVPLKETRA